MVHFTAELKNLEEIRRFVEDRIEALQIDPSITYDVLLAVTEMVTNIIEHGYKGEPGSIEVEVGREEDALVVRIRDQAAPFDPTGAPPPDLNLPLEKRPIGGLGIFLAKHFVDSMTHRYTPQGGNELTLVKKGMAK